MPVLIVQAQVRGRRVADIQGKGQMRQQQLQTVRPERVVQYADRIAAHQVHDFFF